MKCLLCRGDAVPTCQPAPVRKFVHRVMSMGELVLHFTPAAELRRAGPEPCLGRRIELALVGTEVYCSWQTSLRA